MQYTERMFCVGPANLLYHFLLRFRDMYNSQSEHIFKGAEYRPVRIDKVQLCMYMADKDEEG